MVKLARWSVERRRSGFKNSLSLISISKYSKAYQELKEKYKGLVKVWPEVTDPEKFVYEDVAIAAYLLILWEQERAERGVVAKQSFVDLGCGNGLLVHILSSEGHPGRGIDVRRRKIWDMYGPQTHLEEGAITPNDKTLFPDVDWLIGNHSDELTPWIPVIAARCVSLGNREHTRPPKKFPSMRREPSTLTADSAAPGTALARGLLLPRQLPRAVLVTLTATELGAPSQRWRPGRKDPG